MFSFIDRRYSQDAHTITRNVSRLERVGLLIEQISKSDILTETQRGGGITYLIVEIYKGSTKLFVDGIKDESLKDCEDAVWSIINEFGDYEFVFTVLRFGLIEGTIFPSSALQKLFGILTQKKTKETESKIARQFKAKAKKMEFEKFLALLSEPKPKEKRDKNQELIGRMALVTDKMSPYYAHKGIIKEVVNEGEFLLSINDDTILLDRSQFRIKKYGFKSNRSPADKTRVKVKMFKKGMKAFRV
ncbi:hypothetical protein [Brevibacillus choshinensis]|uniref:hypothetical protein n=1 Tax=Brevibacillus choshinensis TaxID=54911 RepID=UPI002E1D1DB8|nr:hypothetical protein [Brevibacillus choshinensis]